MPQTTSDERIEEVFADSERLLEAANRGFRRAMRIHKALGIPMTIWEDGKVKQVPPEEIPDYPLESIQPPKRR